MQSGNISDYKCTYWDDQKKIVLNLQSGTAIKKLSTFEIPCEHDSGLCHDLDHRELITTWCNDIVNSLLCIGQPTHSCHEKIMKKGGFL